MITPQTMQVNFRMSRAIVEKLKRLARAQAHERGVSVQWTDLARAAIANRYKIQTEGK